MNVCEEGGEGGGGGRGGEGEKKVKRDSKRDCEGVTQRGSGNTGKLFLRTGA